MADADGRDVQSILAAHREQYRTVQVNKDIGVHYDVGNLTVSDVNLLDSDALRYVAMLHSANDYVSTSKWPATVFTVVFPAYL